MDRGNGSDEASLDYSLKYNPPIDPAVAERNLKEVKGILDGLGVVFMFGSGSCLGAVREKAFIPWDDDIDLLAVIGVNGLTDEGVDLAAARWREAGYFVRQSDAPRSKLIMSIKDYARIGLESVRIIDGQVYSYPGIALPAEMFTRPREIEFLGERFNVPNPPEEYLATKYGPEWNDAEEGRGVREGRGAEDARRGMGRSPQPSEGAGRAGPARGRRRGNAGGRRPLQDRPGGIRRDYPAGPQLVRPGHQVPRPRGGALHGGAGAGQGPTCTGQTLRRGIGTLRAARLGRWATCLFRSESARLEQHIQQAVREQGRPALCELREGHPLHAEGPASLISLHRGHFV